MTSVPCMSQVDVLGYFLTWNWNALYLFVIQVSETSADADKVALGHTRRRELMM